MRLVTFILLVVVLAGCGNYNKVLKKGTPQERYDLAIKLYEQKRDYAKAAPLFEELIPIYKGRKESEIVNYYYAYCQYHLRNLELSSYYFSNFYKTFPNSQYAADAQFMYALSMYEDTPRFMLDQSNTLPAISALQQFITDYPENTAKVAEVGRLIENLRVKLEEKAYNNAKLYYNIDYYRAAVVAMDNFISDYPLSAHVEEFMFLKIDSEYELAKMSVFAKQRERYEAAKKFYLEFIDRFPASRYLSRAEDLYTRCNGYIAQIDAEMERLRIKMAERDSSLTN